MIAPDDACPTPSIDEKIAHYRQQFAACEDVTARYTYLIDLARRALPFPEEFRIDPFRVPGCLSRVWLVPRMESDTIRYVSDSDALLVKGTVTLISDVYSGHTPAEIMENTTDLLTALPLGFILSMNRRNGAYFMLRRVKEYAQRRLTVTSA